MTTATMNLTSRERQIVLAVKARLERAQVVNLVIDSIQNHMDAPSCIYVARGASEPESYNQSSQVIRRLHLKLGIWLAEREEVEAKLEEIIQSVRNLFEAEPRLLADPTNDTTALCIEMTEVGVEAPSAAVDENGQVYGEVYCAMNWQVRYEHTAGNA